MTTFLDQTQDYNPFTGDVNLNPAAWGLSLKDINSAASVELRSSLYAGNANLTADQYREVQELVRNKYSGVDYTGMIKGSGMSSDISMLGRDPGLYMNQERLGYWKNDTDQWQAYIANNGNFAFQGDANNYISWNGSELVIRGSIFLEDGTSITDMNNTFYQDTAPTVFTDGDLWFDTNDGNKMYLSVASTWTSVQDTLAIGLANTAQATADGKATVYYQTSAPTLGAGDVGDLWVDTDNNNIVTTWNGTAWVATSNTDAIQALANAATAQATADGKIDTYYQATAPASASEGDIWFDTDDGNKMYTYRSAVWVNTQDTAIGNAITAAAGAQATADGKVTTFYLPTSTPPTAEGVGDLWYDTTSTIIKRWNGSSWQDIRDIGAARAATSLDSDSRYTKWLESNLITETKVKTGYTGVVLDNDGIGGYTAGVASFRIDRATGAAFYSGSVTAAGLDVGTAGNVRGGQTAYNTGTGFWIGYSSGAHKFSIGNGTKGLTWDGTNFNVRGILYAESGTFAGAITSTATITGGTLQTASSGARAVIGSGGSLELYNATVKRIDIRNEQISLYEPAGALAGYFYGFASGVIGLNAGLGIGGDMSCLNGSSSANFTVGSILYANGRLKIPVGSNLY